MYSKLCILFQLLDFVLSFGTLTGWRWGLLRCIVRGMDSMMRNEV